MKTNQLTTFLREHLSKLTAIGSCSLDDFEFPDFELAPFDYLDFAERA